MALSPPELPSLLVIAREESVAQGVAGFLHQGVAGAAAFEDAGFEAIGAVGDFAVREMFEKWEARREGACRAGANRTSGSRRRGRSGRHW